MEGSLLLFFLCVCVCVRWFLFKEEDVYCNVVCFGCFHRHVVHKVVVR